MTRLGLTTATLLLAWASAYGQEATTDDAGRALVESFVNDVDTLVAGFEQSLIDASGQVVEVTSGSLEIMRPDRFRWTYVEPYEQILIADGMNMWSYDVDLAQVTVKPQAEALSNTPALLLGGSAAALEQFENEGSVVKDGTTWVTLRPRNTESGFLRVELGFADSRIGKMVFFDHLDQTTIVTLFDVVINEPVDANRFVFSAPADVDLIGSPAVAEATSP